MPKKTDALRKAQRQIEDARAQIALGTRLIQMAIEAFDAASAVLQARVEQPKLFEKIEKSFEETTSA